MANRSNRVRSSSSQPPTMSSDDDGSQLPQDVVVEILKRLPAATLLRFRCVCRSWRSAIDDPSFAALHLSHSALDASNWYVACLDCCDPVQRLCSLFPIESLTLPSMSQIEIPFAAPPDCYCFIGSCNGLICLTEDPPSYGQTMYLWNFFARKQKAVRGSHPEREFLSESPSCVAVGFGFDARSNDYKIVRILYLLDGSETKDLLEIYTLSTDSWRSLECEVPAFCGDDPAVFFNGNLHWLVFEHDDLQNEGEYGSIVLFDVAGEVFDEMALPEEIFREHSDVAGVAVLNDLLAVFNSFMDAEDPKLHSVCSVWVMREYGVPESWTKLYTLKARGQVTTFGGSMRNGELVMDLDDQTRISWNPITGQFAKLPLSTTCDWVSVVGSFVSL